MKLRHILIAGAVSWSVGSLAFAQQAQEAQPSQKGSMDQGASGQMGAQEQGAAGAQQQYPQETVRQVQQKLNNEGFQAGPVDGIWGPKTQSAVKNFQQKKGIEATGQLDEKTLAELDVEAQAMGGAGGAAGNGAKDEAAKQGAGGAAGEAGKEDAAKDAGGAAKEDAAKEGAGAGGAAGEAGKEDKAQEGAGGATGAAEQPGAQKPGEQEAPQPGPSQPQSR